MKLNNIAGFKNIQEFVNWKINSFKNKDKNFSNLFEFMFSESKNIFAEKTNGYKIQKTTYEESKKSIIEKSKILSKYVKQNTIVGLSMPNSLEWIEWFWAILRCGANPLLINDRIPVVSINEIIKKNNVDVAITKGFVYDCKNIDVELLTNEKSTLGDCNHTWGTKVYFMSSGTSGKIKLCGYTAENFYYQLCNSVDIVNNCPQISKHFNGELKQLALLPFYHVFGFIAVYLWFGFFSRTFVFLKDLNPQTIQLTIKKHKVTHFFAVPLVWEGVYKASIRVIKGKGERVYSKFLKGLTLANQGRLGEIITKKAMGEVRNSLFGDSIQFLISGGGAISKEALSFFNGIGYTLANGYGMTEVGITSVETSDVAKIRSKGSIGQPFKYTEYSLNENGELLIKGKNMASEIIYDDMVVMNNGEKFFNSHDLAKKVDSKFYSCGRTDDLIVSKTGEKLNPYLLEKEIHIDCVSELCILDFEQKSTLLLSSGRCYSKNKLKSIVENAKKELERLNVYSEINNVLVTTDSLLKKDEFKMSRKAIKQRILNKEITILDTNSIMDVDKNILENKLEKEVCLCFMEVLNKGLEEIGKHSHFFTDLGGSSLDYFILADLILEKFGVDIKNIYGKSLYSVNDISECIRNV